MTMTADRTLKHAARERAATTGVPYTQARRELLDAVPTPFLRKRADVVAFDFPAIDSSSGIPLATFEDDGEHVTWDPRYDPHLLIAGQVGSGKSAALQTICFGSLVRGWDVYVIEPTKGAVDFEFAELYVRAIAADVLQAAVTMKEVYAEFLRRMQTNAHHGVSTYRDLPEDVRPAHLLVVVDEFTSLVTPEPVTAVYEHPLMTEEREALVEANRAKTEIGIYIAKIARQGRAAGVSLVLATQQASAKMFETIPGAGDLKANLSRLALGRPSFGEREQELRAPSQAPDLGDRVATGRGLWESTTDDGPRIVQGWFDMRGQAGLRDELAARFGAPELATVAESSLDPVYLIHEDGNTQAGPRKAFSIDELASMERAGWRRVSEKEYTSQTQRWHHVAATLAQSSDDPVYLIHADGNSHSGDREFFGGDEGLAKWEAGGWRQVSAAEHAAHAAHITPTSRATEPASPEEVLLADHLGRLPVSGSRVRFAESRRSWRVRAVSATGRYVGLSSPNNLAGSDFYTVIDTVDLVRGPDDRFLGGAWITDDDFTEHLAELEAGESSISQRRRVELDIAEVLPPDPRRKADPPATLAAPDDLAPHPDGVVLVADAKGRPVRFDLTRGMRYIPSFGFRDDRPDSLYPLLAAQAKAAGRDVHIVTDAEPEDLLGAFPGATRYTSDQLDDLLRRASTSDLGLVIVASLPVDLQGFRDDISLEQMRTWNYGDVAQIDRAIELRDLAGHATAAGTWLLQASMDIRADVVMASWPARLAFGYGERRSAFGQPGVRKRMIPVPLAGLARRDADGPLVPVRAYS